MALMIQASVTRSQNHSMQLNPSKNCPSTLEHRETLEAPKLTEATYQAGRSTPRPCKTSSLRKRLSRRSPEINLASKLKSNPSSTSLPSQALQALRSLLLASYLRNLRPSATTKRTLVKYLPRALVQAADLALPPRRASMDAKSPMMHVPWLSLFMSCHLNLQPKLQSGHLKSESDQAQLKTLRTTCSRSSLTVAEKLTCFQALRLRDNH